MRRLTFLVAAALVVGCYGTPAGSIPLPSAADGRSVASRAPTVSPSTEASTAATVLATPTLAPTRPPTPRPSSAAACGFPTTLLVLAGRDPAWPVTSTLILECLGRADIQITGWLAAPWGIGWGSPRVEPAWLGDMFAMWKVLWLKPIPTDGTGSPLGCIEETDCVWLALSSPNASELPLTPDRWVAITGHFDDPAAATCSWTGPAEGYSQPLTKTEAVRLCRSHFVVTAIEDVPILSSPTP